MQKKFTLIGKKAVVISGSCKGQTGRIKSYCGQKYYLEGINLKSCHRKSRDSTSKGEKIQIEGPIHRSNLKIING